MALSVPETCYTHTFRRERREGVVRCKQKRRGGKQSWCDTVYKRRVGWQPRIAAVYLYSTNESIQFNMSSTTTAAAAAPEPKVEAGAVEILEEDDEFEVSSRCIY